MQTSDAAVPDDLGDLKLVQLALARDPRAVAELGNRLECVPALVASANRRMGSPLQRHDLADIAQDTIVVIWQKLETYEGRATLEGWAWSIANLELRNRVRKTARRRRLDGTSLSTLSDDPAQTPPEPMSFDSDELDAALLELPVEVAAIIRLKHDDGLMFKEISARTKISENTAKTRYYRGIARLRKMLDGTVSTSRRPPFAS